MSRQYVDQLAQVVDRDPVLPAGVVDLVREAGPREAVAQVVEDRVVDADLEVLDHAISGRVPGRSRKSSCASSTRIGVPFTSTCRTPVGSSAVRRSPSAGKSRTRRVGPGADRLRIEHAHVGPVALAQVAAAHEAEHVGRLAGQLAHRVLERHDLALAHPGAEQVGRQRRVAQLVDVRARVGEAERDAARA